MSLVLLLAAATAVGVAFDRFSVPGGLIVGAMLGAAAVTLLRGGPEVDIPAPLLTASYVLLGAGIGATVTRGVVVSLRAALLPAVLSAVLIILAGVAIAALRPHHPRLSPRILRPLLNAWSGARGGIRAMGGARSPCPCAPRSYSGSCWVLPVLVDVAIAVFGVLGIARGPPHDLRHFGRTFFLGPRLRAGSCHTLLVRSMA